MPIVKPEKAGKDGEPDEEGVLCRPFTILFATAMTHRFPYVHISEPAEAAQMLPAIAPPPMSATDAQVHAEVWQQSSPACQ
jgi:hypothetical protein